MVMAPTDRPHFGTDLNRRGYFIKVSLDHQIAARRRDEEDILPAAKKICLDPLNKPQALTMNGHSNRVIDSGRYSSNSSTNAASASAVSKSISPTSIASLCNLGNTCFLNSVLYTLRFTPGFLHNLHHLTTDLGIGPLPGGGGGKDKRGSSKNMVANNVDTETELNVIEQLHDLFRNMSVCDDHVAEREGSNSASTTSTREPIAPSNFLHAVGKMNSMFEGNQQQDAHELLIAILTMLRDIKVPSPKVTNSYIDDNDTIDISGKKKSKSKKSSSSFLASNGHSNGVKLVSSMPKMENGCVQAEQPLNREDLPNFVRENFVGKTVFRTKCLECETSTYRSDKFINIDIPLAFDDELSESMSNGFVSSEDNSSSTSSNALSVADLFLRQIMASETLRENNKYLCAECSRLNEAQRSVQFELLPKVLVLQLKRFTAATNKSAYMTKINDFIPTPFTMNCFCVQCLPPDAPLGPSVEQPKPKHHYRLFSVIMHLGATLASGHYIAYVRASVDLNVDYSRCGRANQCSEAAHFNGSESRSQKGGGQSGQSNKKGIMKYFSRSHEKNSQNSNTSSSHSLNLQQNLSSNGGCSSSETNGHQPQNHCRSANCCGMQRILGQLNYNGGRYRQRSQESLDSNGGSEVDSASAAAAGLPPHSEDLWLECDDESISVITRRQFEEELNSKQSATTPYLLFYERI